MADADKDTYSKSNETLPHPNDKVSDASIQGAPKEKRKEAAQHNGPRRARVLAGEDAGQDDT